MHYVVINLVGASLIAASLPYGLAGTLNFADLAVKLPLLPEWDAGLARAAALLLLVHVRPEGRAACGWASRFPQTYGSAPDRSHMFRHHDQGRRLRESSRVIHHIRRQQQLDSRVGSSLRCSPSASRPIVVGAMGVLATKRHNCINPHIVLISSRHADRGLARSARPRSGGARCTTSCTRRWRLRRCSYAIADQHEQRADRIGGGPPAGPANIWEGCF